MKAGRELDTLIAEKVMELRRGTGLGDYDVWYYPPYEHGMIGCPHYSTQIADAWLVVEKWGKHVKIECDNAPLGSTTGVTWQVTFALSGYGEADTAPLAICLAALKAVE